jgi:hypothetical protein
VARLGDDGAAALAERARLLVAPRAAHAPPLLPGRGIRITFGRGRDPTWKSKSAGRFSGLFLSTPKSIRSTKIPRMSSTPVTVQWRRMVQNFGMAK